MTASNDYYLDENILDNIKTAIKRRKEKAAINRRKVTHELQKPHRNTDKIPVRAYSEEFCDILLSYLLNEGYASSAKGAEMIAMNMSESWMYSIIEEFQDLTPTKEQRVKKTLGDLARQVQILGATHKELGKKPLAGIRPGIKRRRGEIAKTAKRKGRLAQNAADALIRTSTSKSANIEFQRQQLLRRMGGEEDSN